MVVDYDNETVGTLKLKIYEKENIHPDQQRLIFAWQELQDERKLTDYSIQEGLNKAILSLDI